MKNNEIYIAGSISRPCEQEWHSKISKKLIDMGYETYAPAENKSINDKTNKPTPLDIFEGDVSKLESCDILLVELHGGKQDGTIWECGWACGWNNRNDKYNEMVDELQQMINYSSDYKIPTKKNKIIFFYTSNTRLLNNAIYDGIPSESLNHLVLGGFVKFGRYLGSPDEMLKFMNGFINNPRVRGVVNSGEEFIDTTIDSFRFEKDDIVYIDDYQNFINSLSNPSDEEIYKTTWETTENEDNGLLEVKFTVEGFDDYGDNKDGYIIFPLFEDGVRGDGVFFEDLIKHVRVKRRVRYD